MFKEITPEAMVEEAAKQECGETVTSCGKCAIRNWKEITFEKLYVLGFSTAPCFENPP